MRTKSAVVAAALGWLVVGVAVGGCSAEGATTEGPSAKQMLDDANDTMKALKSVTIDGDITETAVSGPFSTHLTTDLKGRCAGKTTWDTGASFEQIRIGATAYIRPNRTFLEQDGETVTNAEEYERWVETPVDLVGPELPDCTRPFTSFGKATKGQPTKVNGSAAIPLVVTDKEDKEGTYTFYVASEGKPYILKVVYKGANHRSTTTFSAFDKPLDVRAPAKGDLLYEDW
ncbi:hypothetical protein ACQEVY_14610 [Streptomyces sp. CA-288835]|uniref:hypothetical protein n=1 Tax=Streptomyces sp. CA-288835 TaxID=3240069 RepID=UPI003D8FD250